MAKPATVAVLGTRYIDLSIEEHILGPRGVRIVTGDGAGPDAIAEQAAEAVVVMAGSGPRFDRGVIDRLTCRGIVRYGVGVDSIDLDAAARSGMWVAFVPDYGTDAVALHSVTILLAALRRLVRADAEVKAGRWGISELRPLRAPHSMTVGIVGYGRIGRRVAELLAPFGFVLVAHDPHVDVAARGPGVRALSLEELLSTSDVVTLHAPAAGDRRPLIGRAELGRLKEDVVLVNTARGELIDQQALLDGLRRGRPAFAALDVFDTEPPPASLFESLSDRVILTPHMAWYTEEAERDLRTKAASEALRILDGMAPLHAAARPGGVE